MSKLYSGLALIICLALAFSSTELWKTRQELQQVLSANRRLRVTLGELTAALAAKDEQIERLLRSPCQTPERRTAGPSRKSQDAPQVTAAPGRTKSDGL